MFHKLTTYGGALVLLFSVGFFAGYLLPNQLSNNATPITEPEIAEAATEITPAPTVSPTLEITDPKAPEGYLVKSYQGHLGVFEQYDDASEVLLDEYETDDDLFPDEIKEDLNEGLTFPCLEDALFFVEDFTE